MSTNINYLSRDFNSSKQSLLDFAKIYFPEAYNDFAESDPAMLFIEMSAYVSDILNFYIDKSVQENFIQYSQNKENILALAYFLGYRPKVTATSTVDLDIYQVVPAKIGLNTTGPDFDYALVIDQQSKIKSVSKPDTIFITKELVDFSFSSSYNPTDVSVYEINNNTNLPEYYLLKKNVKAIAGDIKTQEVAVSGVEKFFSTKIEQDNIIEILDVIDSDGNKWYEVPYLAQDIIIDQVSNNKINNPNGFNDKDTAPYLLKFKKVQRRFTTRFESDGKMILEFGSGVSNFVDEEIIPNMDNIGIGLYDNINKSLQAYDPNNFLYTKEYGLAPSNTVLKIRYISGGGVDSNVPANDITQKYEISIKSSNIIEDSLNQSLLTYVKNSVAFNNEKASSGGGSGDTIDDIRLKSMASFSTQLRSVTQNDHIIRAYSMPSNFGTIAKAYMTKDTRSDSNKYFEKIDNLNLNMYILSYNSDKKLVNTSLTVKNNLKNYLDEFRIITESISLKDAYYINIGVNFDIMVIPSYNNREVLTECLQKVKDLFNIDKWSINQPIILSQLRQEIGYVKGVQSVTNIEVVNKNGVSDGYSRYGYDIKAATKMDVIYPSKDPAIFEVRYPDVDIYGKVITI